MERINVWELKKRINDLKLEKSDSKDLLTMALKSTDSYSVATNFLGAVDKRLRSSFLEYLSKLREEVGEKCCDRVICYGNIRGRWIKTSFSAVLDCANSSVLIDKVFQIEMFSKMIVPKSKNYVLISLSSTSLLVGELYNEWKISYKMTSAQFFEQNKAVLQSKNMNQYNNERILQYMLSNVDSWDEEFFKSALDGVLIGLHYSMKSLVSLDKIDEKIKNSKPTLVGITKYDEASFDEIMERASEKLQNNFVFQEIKALNKYYDRINEERDDDLKSSAKGLQATLKAIDCSSLACLLVDENFEAKRSTLRKKGTDEERVQVFLAGSYLPIYNDKEEFVHQEEDFLEWLIDISKKTKFTLELISGNSKKGVDFVKGTEGIAGLMKFKQDLSSP